MQVSFDKILSLILKKLENWFVGLSANLPNILVAIFVIGSFWFLAKLARRAVHDLLHKLTHNEPVARLMSGIIHILVLLAGFFIALGLLNLDKAVTSLLAGAGVVGLAIGFAFQEIASNFIAGIIIAFRRLFRVGDIVKVNDHEGRILDIDLRITRISTYDGLEVLIPNKDMFTNAVVNFTATPTRRVDLEVGVSYGEDLRQVRELVLEALEGVTGRVTDKAPEVFFTTFADSSINFQARVWISKSDPISYLTSQNDMVILIKEAFDRSDIVIPFPIRTLDFGIKGGLNAAEALKLQDFMEIANRHLE